MARIEIDGNLGQDADLRYTPSGIAVLNFSVADNHYRKGPDGERAEDGVTWHEVTVWEKAAETLGELPLLSGARVFVLGDMRLNEFTTREGETRRVSKVRAFKVVPYPAVPNTAQPAQQARQQAAQPQQQAAQQWPDEPPF